MADENWGNSDLAKSGLFRLLFKRHPMGVPSVLSVAVLALVGMWWTFEHADSTQAADSAASVHDPDDCPVDAPADDGCRVSEAPKPGARSATSSKDN